MIPIITQPVCQASGCKHVASILSKKGDTIKYMMTCARHSYKDIASKTEK
jgi:hypothetical protein